jgi:hypothetical protein
MYVVISTTVCGLSTLSQICAGALLFTTARKHYYMYIWMAYQSLYLEDCVFIDPAMLMSLSQHMVMLLDLEFYVFKRLLFVLFSFGHCVVCPSLIYGF